MKNKPVARYRIERMIELILYNIILNRILSNKISEKYRLYEQIIILIITWCWYIKRKDWTINNNIIYWNKKKIINNIYGTIRIENIFCLNTENIIIILLVLIITINVLIYSINYNKGYDNRLNKKIILFSICMKIYSISINNIIILSSYEYIGIISYLLINTYRIRKRSNKSSVLSMIIGKIGDIGIIISILLKYNWKKSLLNNRYILENNNIIIKIGLLLAVMSKSAQIFLLNWLILAMNAPTPVSSLLLSSTLVTSGILWIYKLNILSSKIFLYFGLLTIIIIGFSSLFTFDVKKLIALSTSSQIGFILIIISLNNIDLFLYLIITLGCIKNLLFLSIGIIISNLLKKIPLINPLGNLLGNPLGKGEKLYKLTNQDIRKCINKNNEWLSLFTLIISLIGLMGFPYLSIYFSKDLLLILCWIFTSSNLFFVYNLLLFASIFTIIYSFRIYFSIISTIYPK